MSVGEFEPVREQAFKIMAFILFFIFPRIDVRKFGKRESQGGWKIAKNPFQLASENCITNNLLNLKLPDKRYRKLSRRVEAFQFVFFDCNRVQRDYRILEAFCMD